MDCSVGKHFSRASTLACAINWDGICQSFGILSNVENPIHKPFVVVIHRYRKDGLERLRTLTPARDSVGRLVCVLKCLAVKGLPAPSPVSDGSIK